MNNRIPEDVRKTELMSCSVVSATRKMYMPCRMSPNIAKAMLRNCRMSCQCPSALKSMEAKFFRTVWKIFICVLRCVIFARMSFVYVYCLAHKNIKSCYNRMNTNCIDRSTQRFYRIKKTVNNLINCCLFQITFDWEAKLKLWTLSKNKIAIRIRDPNCTPLAIMARNLNKHVYLICLQYFIDWKVQTMHCLWISTSAIDLMIPNFQCYIYFISALTIQNLLFKYEKNEKRCQQQNFTYYIICDNYQKWIDLLRGCSLLEIQFKPYFMINFILNSWQLIRRMVSMQISMWKLQRTWNFAPICHSACISYPV